MTTNLEYHAIDSFISRFLDFGCSCSCYWIFPCANVHDRANGFLVGHSFLDSPFSPSENKVLLKTAIKDVTVTLRSKYNNAASDQFPLNQFVVELQQTRPNGMTVVQTIEAYTSPQDSTRILTSTKTIDKNGVGGSSAAFSKGNGNFNFNLLGLNMAWSVEKSATGQLTHFNIDNQIDVTLTDAANSPSLMVIKQQSPMVVTEGMCSTVLE